MAARVTVDTSDDSHLADDSKQREDVAGHSGYAPPVQEERRIASDGNGYTFRECLEFYGEELGTSSWTAAPAAVNTLLTDTHPLPSQQERDAASAAVNTLL